MEAIRQHADGNGFKRMTLFHFSIGAPQALDMPDQQIASVVREREEESSTFDQEPTVTGHPSLPITAGGRCTPLSAPGLVGTALRAFAHPILERRQHAEK